MINVMEVKSNEIVQLYEPIKEGFTFTGWINEEGKIIGNEIKVNEDIILKVKWISNDVETITIEYNTGSKKDSIVIEKGDNILLPIEPVKTGYIFSGWIDDFGYLITDDLVLNDNIILNAIWISESAKTYSIRYNIDDKIVNTIIESGSIIILPNDPIKPGYVFNGWVDENGNKILEDTIINKDVTINATWKELYTCPSDCIPIEDGSKCTKTYTKDLVKYTGCVSGTEDVKQFCSIHKRQVEIGFDEDASYVSAGIMCEDNVSGFCVDYNNRYTISGDTCPNGYYKYIDSDGFGAVNGCAKKYEMDSVICPSGYTQSGSVCKRTETISCKAN